jgi:hypothetical protein
VPWTMSRPSWTASLRTFQRIRRNNRMAEGRRTNCAASSAFSKSLAEFRARRRERELNPFSPATCASEKIHYGLQTCELCAAGAQRVRCGRPQLSRKSGKTTFSTVSGRRTICGRPFVCSIAIKEHGPIPRNEREGEKRGE